MQERPKLICNLSNLLFCPAKTSTNLRKEPNVFLGLMARLRCIFKKSGSAAQNCLPMQVSSIEKVMTIARIEKRAATRYGHV